MARGRANLTLNLVTEPLDPVVSLAEMKKHLHVDTSADDERITGLIQAATSYFDGRDGILGRALRAQTWQVTAAGFPDIVGPISPYQDDMRYIPNGWRLPLPPTISVDEVDYTDTEGNEQVLAASSYVVTAGGYRGAIVCPADGSTWPAAASDLPDAARITFTAGYQSNESPADNPVPRTLQQAIIITVQSWYDQPSSDIPEPAISLASPYRMAFVG